MHVDSYRYTTVPEDSEIVYVVDSTNLLGADAGSVAAATAPGTQRGQFAGYRCRLVIKVGDQAVTWTAQIMTDDAGASTDWENDTTLVHATGSGTGTLAASTTYKFTWYPSAEFRFAITAGGTAPDDLDVQVTITQDPAPEA